MWVTFIAWNGCIIELLVLVDYVSAVHFYISKVPLPCNHAEELPPQLDRKLPSLQRHLSSKHSHSAWWQILFWYLESNNSHFLFQYGFRSRLWNIRYLTNGSKSTHKTTYVYSLAHSIIFHNLASVFTVELTAILSCHSHLTQLPHNG